MRANPLETTEEITSTLSFSDTVNATALFKILTSWLLIQGMDTSIFDLDTYTFLFCRNLPSVNTKHLDFA